MNVKFTDFTADRQADVVLNTLFRDGGPMTEREVAMRLSVHSPNVTKPLDVLKQTGVADYQLIDHEWMYTITEKGREVAMSPDFYANQAAVIDVPVTRKTPEERAAAVNEPEKKIDGRTKEAKSAKRLSKIIDTHIVATTGSEVTLPNALKATHHVQQSGGISGTVKQRCVTCRIDRPISDFTDEEQGVWNSKQCKFCIKSIREMALSSVPPKPVLSDLAAIAIDEVLTKPDTASTEPKFGIFSNGEVHIHSRTGITILPPDEARGLVDFLCALPEKLFAQSSEESDVN